MNVTFRNNTQFSLPALHSSALKSTMEKNARQQKMQNQVAFFEKQKSGLKNVECNGVEEIAKKLEMLHTYEDEIIAAKQTYNNEQMYHMMDEEKEIGEKIAKAIDKTAPKTEEERKEAMVEEALGTEEEQGVLSDMLEETEVLTEEAVAEMPQELKEKTVEEMISENIQAMKAKQYVHLDLNV